MDIYALFKFLHVACVIVWVGSGIGLVALGIAAERKNDKEEFGRIVAHVVFMAPRVFIPASIAALVFGLITAWLQWSFADLWIVLGLIGFAATFVTGTFFLKPRADKIAQMIAKEGYSDAVVALGRELLSVSKFDYVVLFLVVAVMVFKPTISDYGLLIAMAAILVAAGAYFLRGVIPGTPARA